MQILCDLAQPFDSSKLGVQPAKPKTAYFRDDATKARAAKEELSARTAVAVSEGAVDACLRVLSRGGAGSLKAAKALWSYCSNSSLALTPPPLSPV